MTPVPAWLAGLYYRLMGCPVPHEVASLCQVVDDICLMLFPFEQHIQEELLGGSANLRMMRLLLLECHRNGDEAAVTFIEGMTSFFWPK